MTDAKTIHADMVDQEARALALASSFLAAGCSKDFLQLQEIVGIELAELLILKHGGKSIHIPDPQEIAHVVRYAQAAYQIVCDNANFAGVAASQDLNSQRLQEVVKALREWRSARRADKSDVHVKPTLKPFFETFLTQRRKK